MKCSFGKPVTNQFGKGLFDSIKDTINPTRKSIDELQNRKKNAAEEEMAYQDYSAFYCGAYTPDAVCRAQYQTAKDKTVPRKYSLRYKDDEKSKPLGPIEMGKFNLYINNNNNKSKLKKHLKDLMDALQKYNNKKSASFGKCSNKRLFGFQVLSNAQIIEKTYKNPFGGPNYAKNPDACLAFGHLKKLRSRTRSKRKSIKKKNSKRKVHYKKN